MSAGMPSMPNLTAYENPQVSASLQSAPTVPIQQPSDQAIEATALAGSAAIRRIIAERNELRRDGERLRGVIQELRHENAKTANAGEQYKQLATELLLQLKQMHQAIQDAQDKIRQLSTNTLEDRDPGLTSLARRFASGSTG